VVGQDFYGLDELGGILVAVDTSFGRVDQGDGGGCPLRSLSGTLSARFSAEVMEWVATVRVVAAVGTVAAVGVRSEMTKIASKARENEGTEEKQKKSPLFDTDKKNRKTCRLRALTPIRAFFGIMGNLLGLF